MPKKLPVLKMEAEFEFRVDCNFIGSRGRKGTRAKVTGFRLIHANSGYSLGYDPVPQFRVEGVWKSPKWIHASMFKNIGD